VNDLPSLDRPHIGRIKGHHGNGVARQGRELDLVAANDHLYLMTSSKRASNVAAYSSTVSARSKNVSGIVRPMAFAVLRLMASSNFVGCSMGKSLGCLPCKIL
jgi:hypothetical protein